MRRMSAFLAVGLLVAACGSESGFEVDPAVMPGINPYVFTWDEPADGPLIVGERNYLLYVPEEYLDHPDDPWPLVLYLHGLGEVGDDPDVLAGRSLPGVLQSMPYRFIMAAPQAANGDVNRSGWAWFHFADQLMGFIDRVRSQVNIDPNRIYVTGHSLGAIGAWAFAAAYPDVPAALVPVAGGWYDLCPNCRTPADWIPKVPDNICDLAGIPTWVFHGDVDSIVPLDESQAMVTALEACGGDVRFSVLEGVGHAPAAYDDPALFEWMLSQGTDREWPILSE